MKKALAIILALSFLVLTFVGCGGGKNNDDSKTTTAGGESSVTTQAEEKAWFEDLNYDGLEITIPVRADDGLVANTFIGEDGGDVQDASIYEANMIINEKLGVNRNFVAGGVGANGYIANVSRIIESDPGEYDLLMPDQFHGSAYVANGTYLNINDLECENNYLDITTDGWYQDYIDSVTMGDDIFYFLAGDSTITLLKWASCCFVNIAMYDDLFGGEGAINDFLYLVEEGKWTIELMREKCTAAYLDINQNQKVDLGDRLGCTTSKGQSAVFAAIAAGMTFSKRLEDGTYKLLLDDPHNVEIFERVFDLYNSTTGFYTYNYSSVPTANSDTFGAGNALFLNEYFTYADRAVIREMTDGYVIIPRAKYDETQTKYLSSLQDSLMIFAIPSTTPADMHEALSAVLQFSNEIYRDRVMPAIYEQALKTKYVADEIDVEQADRLIDLVRNGIHSDFAVVYTSSLNGLPNMVGNLVEAKQKKWTSMVAMNIKKYNACLDDLMLSFGIVPEY